MYEPAALIGIGVALPAIAALTVGLRFYTRHIFKERSLLHDDWLVLLGLLLVIAMAIIQIYGKTQFSSPTYTMNSLLPPA